MSVGKFCTKHGSRVAWYDGRGGVLRHETAGLVKVKKVNNHYALECWARSGHVCNGHDVTWNAHEGNIMAPVGAAAAAARPGEEDDGHTVSRALAGEPGPAGGPRAPAGEQGAAGAPPAMHSSASRVAAEARPASDVLADVPAEGPAAIPDDRVHREPEVTAQGIPGPREPSAEEIERHELTHYPAEPWCEICVQAKANDLAHRRVDRKGAIIPADQLRLWSGRRGG